MKSPCLMGGSPLRIFKQSGYPYRRAFKDLEISQPRVNARNADGLSISGPLTSGS